MTEPAIAPAPPVTLVIFGATGDLTRRLLVPTILNMTQSGLVNDSLQILGIGLDPGDDEMLRAKLEAFLATANIKANYSDETWQQLRSRISYLQGDFTQEAIYTQIANRLGEQAGRNAAYYLAVPPLFFGDIVDKLADNGLLKEDGSFRRLVIEKPFGTDLASAKALNARILNRVPESQVYRVDHFLGKETVQNIMTARFANMMIESIWSNNFIDHVQITAAELVDVGTRGKFYDATGALRDMVPNHLFQLLAMVAMEAPNSFDAEAIRDEKGKVLKALRIYSPEEAEQNSARGAYTAGVSNGNTIPAYTDIADVAHDSATETFVALKLHIDTWRWAGVPFYLRTGKAMTARDTEIIVTFRQVPFAQFKGMAPQRLTPNRLIIQVQPDEGLHIEISIKSPGLSVEPMPISLDFNYADFFDIGKLTGYESLLYDLFDGDQTLFQRADSIEAGWAAVQPFLDLWSKSKERPDTYPAGSMGPQSADALIERDGRKWHQPDVAHRVKAKVS
ncbi:glucose-6-phosphate dehydrogenase [Phyllobacterium meliloti]|uniref:glucose-6-phosphate dehydrogenase n=1 Tax=Phyllobacterium meliloti TaxID=555317 RepID=UPI001D14354B|nr:glucose-6-phosphate dehydrogenase [Phyllobacterium sp. T1293]UGX89378.1 glucose-6-phosphate dehydrogenase [Phyllobacterium sp. T1293]